MYKYVLSVAGGVAIGIIIAKIVMQMKENQKLERKKILENCFGAPMYTNYFSMSEVREWIKGREDKLKTGAKAVILKVNRDTLQKIGKDLDIGEGIDDNIIIAIVNETNNDIEDSILVKYEKLDEALENALSKGDGVLIVEE